MIFALGAPACPAIGAVWPGKATSWEQAFSRALPRAR
jgi:hypothetical protein